MQSRLSGCLIATRSYGASPLRGTRWPLLQGACHHSPEVPPLPYPFASGLDPSSARGFPKQPRMTRQWLTSEHLCSRMVPLPFAPVVLAEGVAGCNSSGAFRASGLASSQRAGYTEPMKPRRAIDTKPPALLPVMEPLGAFTGRTFPTCLLSQARCIETTGHGLGWHATHGGMHVVEIARLLTGRQGFTIASAEQEIAKALEGYGKPPSLPKRKPRAVAEAMPLRFGLQAPTEQRTFLPN